MTGNGADNPFDRIEALLEFPADFPIKVMGLQDDHFVAVIGALAQEHVPEFDPGSISQTPSRTGKYISLTLPLRVQSREQLEGLYKALADHELVRIVL
jgi:putative lipoic acid-binding regulatory protein